MTHQAPESKALWIIGYGNPQRRDDGLGPYVVRRLQEILGDGKAICMQIREQLGPELVEDLQHAASIIFVDASVNALDGGWRWTRLRPELRGFPYLTHQCDPAFLMGLLEAIYGLKTAAWVISIQGDDFGMGEGLGKMAEERAQKVVAELVQRLGGSVNPYMPNQDSEEDVFGRIGIDLRST